MFKKNSLSDLLKVFRPQRDMDFNYGDTRQNLDPDDGILFNY